MVIGGIHRTARYCRMRIREPSAFEKKSFRTKEVKKGTKIITACPKGKWKNRRCSVGLKLQAVIKEHHGKPCKMSAFKNWLR